MVEVMVSVVLGYVLIICKVKVDVNLLSDGMLKYNNGIYNS